MKRSFLKLAAVLLASVFMMTLAASAVCAAMAGPSAPSFSAVMRHTPKTLFPVPGTAVLTVTDAETGLAVAGAKYDLIRTSSYGGADSKIGTYVTDKDGKITVSHASTGTFCWAAAEAVEGYAADTEKHAFTVVAAQFAETEIALARPAPEPEPEPETDAYSPLNIEKIYALAEFVLKNGTYSEANNPYYLLDAYYPLSDEQYVEVDVVVYVDDEGPASMAIGRGVVESATGAIDNMAILTLTSTPEKTMQYWDETETHYYMAVDGSKFAYTLNADSFVFSVYYEELMACLYEDDSEAGLDATTAMIAELKQVLRDFNTVMTFWDQDITADDIGFPFHNFEDRFTLVLGDNADEIVPVEEDDPLFAVFTEFFGD